MDLNILDYSADAGFNQVRLTAKDYANVADLVQKLDDRCVLYNCLGLYSIIGGKGCAK
jgi:hypothetical protein